MPRTYVAQPTGPYREFALRFRKACAGANMPPTLAGLAAAFGVSKTTVHDWRHGEKLPGTFHLQVIAKKTRCGYDWLATGRGDADLEALSQESIDIAKRVEYAPAEVKGYIKAILDKAETYNTTQ